MNTEIGRIVGEIEACEKQIADLKEKLVNVCRGVRDPPVADKIVAPRQAKAARIVEEPPLPAKAVTVRGEILRLLADGQPRTVRQIAGEIKLSVSHAQRELLIARRLGFVFRPSRGLYRAEQSNG